MACGDVLSLEDLQTAKKHQIFEAEVITGKAGGVAGGATIGTATNPVTGQTQQTLPSILADLGFDVQSWTSSTGGVLASANQVFLNDTSGSLGLGDYYAWGGTFPKTVPAGTDPALPSSGYIMRSSRLAGVQAREALRRSYADAGYSLVDGSFEAGGTLVNADDVLLQERTGKAFSGPAGTVAAGTNPASGGFVDRSNSLVSSERVATKYGTLNVFTDRTAYGPAVGILTTNTPAQNTAAMEAIRAAGVSSLHIPAGVYQFDVFRSFGIAKIFGDGKSLTRIELLGSTTPVSVQLGEVVVQGIHFKSVAGSLAQQRCTFGQYAVMEDCKISDFIHSVPAPDAWGAYFKNSNGCALRRVEFDNNSQSDIAILEGTENLEIDGCFSTTGNLVINLEPNVATPTMRGIVLKNMRISKLMILCNDLSAARDDVVLVENCRVNVLEYDGLGATFINTTVLGYLMKPDTLGRVYGGKLSGIPVSNDELIVDPIFSVVSAQGGSNCWYRSFSSAPPADQYNRRAADGLFFLGKSTVNQATTLASNEFQVSDGQPYLISISREILVYGSRPETVYIRFYDAGGVQVGADVKVVRPFNSGEDVYRAVVVAPTGATKAQLFVRNSDTASVSQVIAYRWASVRKIVTGGSAASCEIVAYKSDLSSVRMRNTKAQFDGNQYYWCPLPVGTEVIFAYASGATRLAIVSSQAPDNTGKFGTLQLALNYL